MSALIVLPKEQIGYLRDEKVFFNVDRRRSRFANGFVDLEREVWLTLGVLGESQEDLGPRPGFVGVKGYWAICGRSTPPMGYEEGDFDYLEITVDYRDPQSSLPKSLGGVSGGGVWQIPLRRLQSGEIEPEECLLSGVAFYQTAIEDGVRFLRCHGRRTVYVRVPEHVENAR
jgi:hypothetical protein